MHGGQGRRRERVQRKIGDETGMGDDGEGTMWSSRALDMLTWRLYYKPFGRWQMEGDEAVLTLPTCCYVVLIMLPL